MNLGGVLFKRLHQGSMTRMCCQDEWYWVPTAVQLSKHEDRNGPGSGDQSNEGLGTQRRNCPGLPPDMWWGRGTAAPSGPPEFALFMVDL